MSKSLQQFTDWAIKAKSVGNPSGGSYKGQCVSLIQQYLNQVFGIPYRARGNAKDFVPPTFKRVSNYRAGDIIRYGANYGGGYGHIGMIDNRGRFLDQNGTKRLAVAVRSTPFGGINAIYRPTKPFNVNTPTVKKATSTQIHALYKEILGRKADAGGLKTYSRYTVAQVRAFLLASAERKQYVANKAKAKAAKEKADAKAKADAVAKAKAATAKAEAERAAKAKEEAKKIDPELAKQVAENNNLLKQLLELVQQIVSKLSNIFK